MIRTRPRRQRGAALLTAMIIVTLVATLASAMVWQQWRSVQVEAAERGRAQATWILYGATDFAKLILYEARGSTTALSDPWATPLAEARISSFLAVDKSNADDGPEAFLSGNIEDAQSRFNLANLLDNANKPNSVGIHILESLCQKVGIETGIAQRIATALALAKAGGASAPLPPDNLSQLTWLGIDQASIDALSPYIIVLPGLTATPINVNTAPAEVLEAVTGVSSASNLVSARQSKPYASVQVFFTQAQITGAEQNNLGPLLAVQSSYFLAHGRLRLADHVLLDNSLIYKSGTAQPTVLSRERVASVE